MDSNEHINNKSGTSFNWIRMYIVLILGIVPTTPKVFHEDPSYTSGIQKCNGNKLTLKNKDRIIRTKDNFSF